ncbi:MAG: DUF1236 domain-containing protein [Xanthobacteraceae bacterium]
MKAALRHGTVLVALLLGVHLGFAQVGSDGQIDSQKKVLDPKIGGLDSASKLRLTDAQKATIASAIRKENKSVTPPPSFVVAVGAPVPPVIELYILPDVALAQVPTAKTVKYTVIQNEIVLVDPTTMRVVDVIKK